MKLSSVVTLFALSAGVFPAISAAQNRCDDAPAYFQPLINTDGQRYPLTIGPIVWHLVGSGIYPVQGSDGKIHLSFAMQLTNVSPFSATIQSVEVVDPSHNNQPSGENHVVTMKNENVTGLMKLFTLPPTADRTSYSSSLAGGQSGVMFFSLTYQNTHSVPCTVALHIRSDEPKSKHAQESAALSPPIKISSQQPIVLSPPFKGDGWVDANGCCLEVGPHRFVTNPMNGTLDPSEQFAIDWIKIDHQGKAFRGGGKNPEQWLCYGTELLAVASGTVVEVMRDLPDVAPGAAPSNLTIPQIAGNHVLLDLGGGRYAMYAHIAPHTVTVHVGEHVHSGQKLGLLGNTGNTTGPHLHFQISHRPSTLDTTSLPFVFQSMLLEGQTPIDLDDIENFSIKGTRIPVNARGSKRLTNAMPLSRDVVEFR